MRILNSNPTLAACLRPVVILIDTNVVAYLAIQGDRTSAVQELDARDADWLSEGSILVEFSNVLATCAH